MNLQILAVLSFFGGGVKLRCRNPRMMLMANAHWIELLGQNSEGLLLLPLSKYLQKTQQRPRGKDKGFESLKASTSLSNQEPLSVHFITLAMRGLGSIQVTSINILRQRRNLELGSLTTVGWIICSNAGQLPRERGEAGSWLPCCHPPPPATHTHSLLLSWLVTLMVSCFPWEYGPVSL